MAPRPMNADQIADSLTLIARMRDGSTNGQPGWSSQLGADDRTRLQATLAELTENLERINQNSLEFFGFKSRDDLTALKNEVDGKTATATGHTAPAPARPAAAPDAPEAETSAQGFLGMKIFQIYHLQGKDANGNVIPVSERVRRGELTPEQEQELRANLSNVEGHLEAHSPEFLQRIGVTREEVHAIQEALRQRQEALAAGPRVKSAGLGTGMSEAPDGPAAEERTNTLVPVGAPGNVSLNVALAAQDAEKLKPAIEMVNKMREYRNQGDYAGAEEQMKQINQFIGDNKALVARLNGADETYVNQLMKNNEQYQKGFAEMAKLQAEKGKEAPLTAFAKKDREVGGQIDRHFAELQKERKNGAEAPAENLREAAKQAGLKISPELTEQMSERLRRTAVLAQNSGIRMDGSAQNYYGGQTVQAPSIGTGQGGSTGLPDYA